MLLLPTHLQFTPTSQNTTAIETTITLAGARQLGAATASQSAATEQRDMAAFVPKENVYNVGTEVTKDVTDDTATTKTNEQRAVQGKEREREKQVVKNVSISEGVRVCAITPRKAN